MTEPVPPTVRAADRARRIGDAARALPLVGMVLVALPVLGEGRSGPGVWMYLFGLWVVLIVTAVILTRLLEDPGPDERPEPSPDGAGPAEPPDPPGAP